MPPADLDGLALAGGWRCRQLVERPAQAAGVFGLVLWIEPAQHRAGAAVHQMDRREIPAGKADLGAAQMAVAVRQLEAAARDHHGAVALALGALLGAGEGEPQRRAVRARPRHLGTSEEARDRRFADLGMALAIVVVLRPGLGRLVEQREREVRHVLEHGESRPSTGPQNASCFAFW